MDKIQLMLNLLTGWVAYCLKENKPPLKINDIEKNAMLAA
jgi:predicted DNA-binding transcriptional regulator